MRRPVRVLGYARVSSLEQALGTSLQDQQDVIRAHAARAVEVARAKLAVRRERYLEQNADGHLDRDELRVRLARLDAERTRLDAAAYEPPPVDKRERRRAARELGVLQRAWRRASPQQRRTIVSTLARAVFLAHGKPPRVDWYTAEDLARRG